MKKMNPRRQRTAGAMRTVRRGFTLLEIVVVVTIIALLATLVAPKLLQNIWKAKHKVAVSNVASIQQQLQIWLADNSQTKPSEDMDLNALTEGADAQLKPSDLIDPWNRPYILAVPGTSGAPFDIISYGANGEPGGEGEDRDVNSNVKE